MNSAENGEQRNGEIREEFSFGYEGSSMASAENRGYRGEIEEDFSVSEAQTGERRVEIKEEEASSTTSKKLVDFIPIYIPAIEEGLIENSTHRKKRFLDFLKARPGTNWFVSSGFRREGGRLRFRVPFIRKISWKALSAYFKKWIRSPANVALLVWLVLCAIGLLFLLLLMLGVLNGVVHGDERRKNWEEVANQIVNALFTLMCVYQHPTIIHHLLLVLRWSPKDQAEARQAYSKGGVQRPHERAHIFFVVSLLHLTCAAQYVYCALFWAWSRHNRPGWPQGLTIGIGTAAPILAAWYTFYGPLGKPVNTDVNGSTHQTENGDVVEVEQELYDGRRVIVTSPEWIGGMSNCCDDRTVACLSFSCTFCVFGWNMERLGFGNMYVHTATFALLCIAPFLIFSVAALNVDDETIRLIVAISGAVCCVFGLLYGGYWRSKMRTKFKLPESTRCCGYPLMTDFMKWLFCWGCALAQEVRTANFYDIEDDGFYLRVTDEEGKKVLVPLPREGHFRSMSCPPNIQDVGELGLVENAGGGCSPFELSINFSRASTYSRIHAMKAPVPLSMQAEDDEHSEGGRQ